jgi:hypothetical protein
MRTPALPQMRTLVLRRILLIPVRTRDETQPRPTASVIQRAQMAMLKGSRRMQTGALQKTVSQGSCVPIGMTAKGDLVFPLHCRELVDLLPETDPSVDESHKTQGRDPTEQPSSIPSNIPGRSADATMMEHPSSNDPVPPGRKELASPKAEPTIGDGASRNGNSMRSVRQSGRKLGSSPKQEQSSPTSSSKTAASQSDEWFNPLGLH